MIPRALTPTLHRVAADYPVVTVTGPRQSGKTTLVRAAFPDHSYVSLEEPDVRTFALEDPRGFLGQFESRADGRVVLDEVQRAPDLFSYIQTLVDQDAAEGNERAARFVLSGSQNFLLARSISQSLAGRSVILHLLPLSWSELQERAPISRASIGRTAPVERDLANADLMTTLHRGFYPRIHERNLDAGEWLAQYTRTYVERDVREILNVGDLGTFGRFLRLCAGRTAQLLNLSSLASDCGVSHTTARRWLSILEASFVVTTLQPHHRNFSKRLIKSPKLYFLDTGLLCYLLRIRSPEELLTHSSRGAIFETFVVSEMLKSFHNEGREPDLYFWRDSSGHEVDLLLEEGGELTPIEIKSGQTVASDFYAGLFGWRRLTEQPDGAASLIYGGDRSFTRSGIVTLSWTTL